ncbi:MAG: hypothetical protein GY751_25895 [Bacteroidetes bacterium]|nr:hypothetical protein [Bacteroidota bacterium]
MFEYQPFPCLLLISTSFIPSDGEVEPNVVNHSHSGVYVISPYSTNSEGKTIPELPQHCPYCDDQSCKIVVDHLRERKTGPCLPLYVMRCKTHGVGFTLYPLGYYPYSRHTLAPVDMEGNRLTRSDDDISLFAGTLFEAATDAANGIPWQHESNAGYLKPRFPTQIRHIQRAAILLGIAPGTEQHLREETAQILAIPGQLLNDTTNQINLPTCGYKCCGKEICSILPCIPAGTLFERLAEAGASGGLWPTPIFLTSNILQSSPFHRVRMRGSPKKKGDH